MTHSCILTLLACPRDWGTYTMHCIPPVRPLLASKQGIVDEDWARQLRCMELQIQLLPQRPWTLPELPQALLGQQLKEALYQLLCYRADQDCAACERLERCSIPNWFTPQLRLSGQMRSFTLGVEHTPGERLDPYHPFCIRMVFLLPPPFVSRFTTSPLPRQRVQRTTCNGR